MERVTPGTTGGIREILRLRKNLLSPNSLFHNPSQYLYYDRSGAFMVHTRFTPL